MKNIVIIGLVSLVLFSVSAALSVWLQSSGKQTAATADDKDHAKKKKGEGDHADDKGHGDEKEKGHADDKSHAAKPTDKPNELKPLAAGAKDAEDRLELRRAQMQVILQDMRAQREEFDKLSKKVAAEMKETMLQADAGLDARAAELSKAEQANAKTTADLKKSRVELEAEEQKNLEKISALTDQMPPDKAAEVIQQLADSGKLDSAVKILVNMKPRTASRVLANISDPALSSQLLERMRSVKQPVAANTEK